MHMTLASGPAPEGTNKLLSVNLHAMKLKSPDWTQSASIFVKDAYPYTAIADREDDSYKSRPNCDQIKT
eukprot:5027971-Amphidinium_carterae.1